MTPRALLRSGGRRLRARLLLLRLAPLATALACLAGCGQAGSVRPPNIVLVIGDDHGYPDSGFMGSPIVQTPNLDRLAQEGTVFRNGYGTASICRPMLRSLLTGLHPAQWQAEVDRRKRDGIQRPAGEWILEFATLPRLLAQRGYASFQGGKFWEASYRVAGFDAGMQLHGDGVNDSGDGSPLGRETLEPVLRFLDANAGQPLFLWFAPMLPHSPFDAPEEYQRPYRERGLSHSAASYYANVTRLDAVVGALRTELEARGLLDDTLLVYLSDNGWDQPPDLERTQIQFDGPRGKRTLYDLGLRTPIVLRWPGQVPAGVVRDELVSAVDLFPTFLDYAGVPLPPDREGHSLRPVLQGKARWPRESVIDAMTDVRGGKGVDPYEPRPERGWSLRRERWHYIRYEGDGEELYDVVADPHEQRDLARERPALVARFHREIQLWRRRVVEPLAQAEPAAATPPPPSPSATR